MKKSNITTGKESALRRLIKGQMAVCGYSTKKLADNMKVPISKNTLYARLRRPSKLRLDELWDILRVLGIDNDTYVKQVLDS